MFDYAYESYLRHAEGYDELRPITCQGMVTWGNLSLTLIDSLDSLIMMKKYGEFQRAVEYVIKNIDLDQNINVSVFETNIRGLLFRPLLSYLIGINLFLVVGGLLSAHLLSYNAEVKLASGWPCKGPLLELAEKVARKLLPGKLAFLKLKVFSYNLISILI